MEGEGDQPILPRYRGLWPTGYWFPYVGHIIALMQLPDDSIVDICDYLDANVIYDLEHQD